MQGCWAELASSTTEAEVLNCDIESCKYANCNLTTPRYSLHSCERLRGKGTIAYAMCAQWFAKCISLTCSMSITHWSCIDADMDFRSW